jgi:aminopeptidase
MHDPRLDRLADLLVRYSTAVRPGDRVSLTGSPAAEPLVVALYREVLRAGGHPFVVMAPEACLELLSRYGSPAQVAFVHPLERCDIETADVVMHLLSGSPPQSPVVPGEDKQPLYSRARQPLMDLFLSRAADRSLRWVATQVPCEGAARDAGMNFADYAEFVFSASLLDRPDPEAAWREVALRQARMADYLQGARELRLVTPRGTDLRLGVAGRVWINGDGHENLPDGEVYTGPIEDATEGVVCFDLPSVHGGEEVQGVRLVFRAGRVVDASATLGEDFLLAMLDQDAGARVLGEAALGCNFAITRHSRNTLFDEKIGGTVHLALGASYPQSAGKNRSGLHWDLICDLRAGGRLEADGHVVCENGRFARPDWPQPV